MKVLGFLLLHVLLCVSAQEFDVTEFYDYNSDPRFGGKPSTTKEHSTASTTPTTPTTPSTTPTTPSTTPTTPSTTPTTPSTTPTTPSTTPTTPSTTPTTPSTTPTTPSTTPTSPSTTPTTPSTTPTTPSTTPTTPSTTPTTPSTTPTTPSTTPTTPSTTPTTPSTTPTTPSTTPTTPSTTPTTPSTTPTTPSTTPTTPSTTPTTPSTASTTPSTPSTNPTTPSTTPTTPSTTPTTPSTTPTTPSTTPTTPSTTPTTPSTTPTTPSTTPTTPSTTPTTPSTTPTTPSTASTTPSTPSTTPTTPSTTPTTPSTTPTTPSTTPTTPSTTPTTPSTTPTTPSTTPTTISTPSTILTTPSTPTTPTTPRNCDHVSTRSTTILTTVTTLKPPTSQESVVESQKIIASIKLQFENKFNVDNDYINRFSDRLNAVKGEFYAALEEQVYRQESPKREALRNALRNNPDIECIRSHEDSVNIAKRVGQIKFDYCESTLRIEVQQQKNQLIIGKERIQEEVRKAELLIENCKRVYLVRYDIDLYSFCTQSAKSNLVEAVNNYNTKIRGQETQNRIVELTECADKSLNEIESTLNENYKTIKDCLLSSNDPVSINVGTTFLDSYIFDFTSLKLKSQIETAITSLTTNVDATTQAAINLKALFQETRKIRDRGEGDLREELELLTEVNKYKLAYLQATTDLSIYASTRDCINQGNDRVRVNLNQRANEVRDCSLRFNLIPTEGNVNDLQNNLKNRDINEGLIALVNCLADRRSILRSNLVASCSASYDSSFSLYVSGVDKQIQFYSQQLIQLKSLFAACQANVLPRLVSQLDIDRRVFEACVMSRSFYRYSLKV